MSRPGFFNDNESRDYPFLTRTQPHTGTGLPHSAIVDFGAIMGLDTEYAEPASTVYLYTVTRTGDQLYFEFRTTATGATNTRLVFTCDIADPEFRLQWADSTKISDAIADPYCVEVFKWTGYLATGTFDDLLLLLPSDGTLTYAASEWVIEPARVQSRIRTFLRSINLANFARTMVTTPQCSQGSDWPDGAYVSATCLQGPYSFMEGYNCAIQQSTVTNTIVIGASQGGGAGVPCEEVPIMANEAPPAGSLYLTGGPACGEIIRTVNGVGGPQITIATGDGFAVGPSDTDGNTLVITMDTGDFAVCPSANILPAGARPRGACAVVDISLGSL